MAIGWLIGLGASLLLATLAEAGSEKKVIEVVDEESFHKAVKKFNSEVKEIHSACESDLSLQTYRDKWKDLQQQWEIIQQTGIAQKETLDKINDRIEKFSYLYTQYEDLSRQMDTDTKLLRKERIRIYELEAKIPTNMFVDEIEGIRQVCKCIKELKIEKADYISLRLDRPDDIEMLQKYRDNCVIAQKNYEQYSSSFKDLYKHGKNLVTELETRLRHMEKCKNKIASFLEKAASGKNQYKEIENGISMLSDNLEIIAEWNQIHYVWDEAIKKAKKKQQEIEDAFSEITLLNEEICNQISDIEREKKRYQFPQTKIIGQIIELIRKLKNRIPNYDRDFELFYQDMKSLEQHLKEREQRCRQKKELELAEYLQKCHSFQEKIREKYIAWSDRAFLEVFYNEIMRMHSQAYGELNLSEMNLNTKIEFHDFCERHNKMYVKSQLEQYDDYFSTMLKYSLDKQQRIAIVSDEDYVQVVAGAGCGKTSTIEGKVNYLTEKKGISPEKILLLVFNKSARKDLEDRIVREGINIHTFHSFGKKVIRETGKDVRVFEKKNRKLEALINDLIERRSKKDKNFAKKLLEFSILYQIEPKSRYDFEKMDDYYKMLSVVGYSTVHEAIERNRRLESEAAQEYEDKQTLQGEYVRSYEELVIANYLFINGIEYEYERVFPKEEWGQTNGKIYTPDFYLKEYDLYWEHFGVGLDGKPGYLDEKGQREYIQAMQMKRKRYEELERPLIETYSWQFSKGLIYKYLEETLQKFNIEKKPIPADDIVQILLSRSGNKLFNTSKNLFVTYLNLYKSRLFVKEDLQRAKGFVQCTNDFQKKRVELFFDIFEELYEEYENFLHDIKNPLIDYNDMISIAIKEIEAHRFPIDYEYVIVDEYQDISFSRQRLLEAIIRNGQRVKLFGVGDDWQSIYRFTGSDINYFTQFGKYWKHALSLKIENTHRNSQELVDIAGAFVMKNQSQMKKRLQAATFGYCPIKVIVYQNEQNNAMQSFSFSLKKAVDYLKDSYKEKNEVILADKEILVLARNNDVLERAENVLGKKRHCYSSIHQSKGGEKTAVILADVEEGIAGFPNQMIDDIILQSLLAEQEKYKYAEERRLFYVALTRTKSEVIITTPQNKMSCFVAELLADHPEIEVIRLDAEEEQEPAPVCQLCGGNMVLRINPRDNTKVWGCSNYKGKNQKGCNYMQKYAET